MPPKTLPLPRDRQRQYLERLGFNEPPPTNCDGLAALQRAHLQSVPFENLDIHLKRSIRLDTEKLLSKLLDQQRGGYCYELNGAFALLLASLGFEVSILEGRVFNDGELGIRFDHACLRVELDEPWLVDVGFGASFQNPIHLKPGIDQNDPSGIYRIDVQDNGWLDLHENGQPQYRFCLTPRILSDFEEGNMHQQTSPSSPFTQNTICSLLTQHGRITIRGLRFIETTSGERTETNLLPSELGPLLTSRFSIVVPDVDVQRLAETG